jgi:hypothetical protein
MYKKIRRSRFIFESLERRQMLAGNVHVTNSNGVLTITGDSLNNAIAITNSSPGVVEILGLETLDPTTNTLVPTTVNGAASRIGVFNGSIVVDFTGGSPSSNKGNDTIAITGLVLNGSVKISTAAGNDIIAVGQFDNSSNLVDSAVNALMDPVTIKQGLFINMQAGDNQVLANHVSLQGPSGPNFTIIGGDGNDTISLQTVVVNHGMSITEFGTATINANQLAANTLNVKLGVGNDHLSLANTTIATTLTLNSDFGNDDIIFNSVSIGTLNTTTGPGNDQVSMTDTSISGATNINTGADDDTVTMTTVTAHALTLTLGTENDTATLTGVTAKATSIAGGDGFDNMSISNSHFLSLSLGGGFGNDTFTMTTVTVDKLMSLDGGAGNDTATLTGLNASAVAIKLGAGTDNLVMDTGTIAQGITIDGGDGNDAVGLKNLHAKTLQVTLDAGADTLSLLNLAISSTATINGGAGNDTSTDMGGNTYGSFKRLNFEIAGTPPSP